MGERGYMVFNVMDFAKDNTMRLSYNLSLLPFQRRGHVEYIGTDCIPIIFNSIYVYKV